MGPNYLSDVIGIDTAVHAWGVMKAAAGEQAANAGPSPNELLFQAGYLGQKNDKGYYQFVKDAKGRPKKTFDPAVLEIIKPAIKGGSENISGEEIVERMMLPMVIEASRCLAEGIVDTATELDMSLVMGLGFPPFRGGLLRYSDRLGAADLVKSAERYENLGPLYRPTDQLKKLAGGGKGFYRD